MALLSPISGPEPAKRGFTLLELMIAMSLLAFLTLGVMSTYLFVGRNLERLMSSQQQGVKARRLIRQFTQDVSSAMVFSPSSGQNYLEFAVPATLALSNCTTTVSSSTVTCASTTGLTVGMAIAGPGIAYAAKVTSIGGATSFGIFPAANASLGGGTMYAVIYVKYTYSTANATLQRNYNGIDNPTLPLLTSIDATVASPANGFFYYNQDGVTVSPTSPFLKQVEFAFTTASGNRAIGTRTTYTIVSPRVIVRNKPVLQ